VATRKQQLTRLVLAALLIAFIAYYIYFRNHPPGPLSYVAMSYSFSDLWNAVVGLIGKPTLVAVAAGFIALAAYITSIPTAGGFSSLHPRNAGMFLVNQALTWLLMVLILVGLLVFIDSLVSTLAFYIPVIIVTIYSSSSVMTDLTYKDFINSPGNMLQAQADTLLKSRFIFPRILLLVIVGEIIYILEYNPSFPLLAWFLLMYAYMGGILTLAQSEGFAFQLVHSKYVQVTRPDDTEFKGFLVSRGSDDFVFVCEDKTFLAPASYVKEIQIIPKPQVKKLKLPGLTDGTKRSP
jgi:hypothetical protein